MDTAETIDARSPVDLLACPHCGAGTDRMVLGLFWDAREEAWRCVICGHRSFEQKRRTDAQLQEETLWDKILAIYDQEKELPFEDEEDGEENVINI